MITEEELVRLERGIAAVKGTEISLLVRLIATIREQQARAEAAEADNASMRELLQILAPTCDPWEQTP